MRLRRWAVGAFCLSTLTLTSCTPPPPYSDQIGQVSASSAATASQTLVFGQSAQVLTRDVRYGVPVVWNVGVDKPKRKAATPTFPEVLCFAVTMTPVAIGRHPVDVTVALPEFTAVAGDLDANYLDDASLCGPQTPPHGYTGELQVGTPFEFYVASWDGLYGIPATGVRLRTQTQTVTWQ